MRGPFLKREDGSFENRTSPRVPRELRSSSWRPVSRKEMRPTNGVPANVVLGAIDRGFPKKLTEVHNCQVVCVGRRYRGTVRKRFICGRPKWPLVFAQSGSLPSSCPRGHRRFPTNVTETKQRLKPARRLLFRFFCQMLFDFETCLKLCPLRRPQ